MQSKDFDRIKQCLAQLEAHKNSLSEIYQLIDWDLFRSWLEQLLQPERKIVHQKSVG